MKSARINLKLLGVFLFISMAAYSQNYSKTPILMSDLKRGINDFEYLRAIFLEKGFQFERRDSDSEFWGVPADGDKHLSQIAVQVSTWKLDGRPNRKVIYLQIRKDLLPKYNEIFYSQLIFTFPDKKAEKVITIDNKTSEEKEDYDLIYYSKDSDVTVEFKENQTWAEYRFKQNANKN
jgi:hypothetical protein